MRKIILLLLVVFVFSVAPVVFLTGCASGPQFVGYGDFKNNPMIKNGTPISIADEVKFYHDSEAMNDGKEVVKGDPDTSQEYTELAVFLKKEFGEQLSGKGFRVVGDDPSALVLRIDGVQMMRLPPNHMIGVIVEGKKDGATIFSFTRASLYNFIFGKERIIRNKIVPSVIEQLDEFSRK